MDTIQGINKQIDSCGGLIAQRARTAYRRVSPAHRRWIDEDDIVQDALVGAVICQKNYRSDQGAKFSTHLYTGLKWHMAHVLDVLALQKRNGEVFELDAQLPSGNTTYIEHLASEEAHPASWLDAAPVHLECERAFITLCRAVSEDAKAVLIRGFLFSDSHGATPELCAEIGITARKLRIGVNDFKPLSQDENLRKKILRSVATDVMLNEGTERALRVLQCIECGGRFTINAIRDGRFFTSTMTCHVCYRKLQESPASISCFGKKKRRGKDGFSQDSIECRLHCRDRATCHKFSEECLVMKEDTDEMQEVDDLDLSEVEEEVEQPKTKKSTKGKAPAPAKKSTKAAKEEKPAKTTKKSKVVDEEPEEDEEEEEKPAKKSKKAPKEPKEDENLVEYSPKALSRYLDDAEKNPEPKAPNGLPKWPYKRGSVTLYLLQRMLLGCVRAEMEKEITKKAVGVDFKGPFKVLSKCWAKGHKFTWKLDEAGGRLKMTDLKYHPKA